jgi:hypothetical protein
MQEIMEEFLNIINRPKGLLSIPGADTVPGSDTAIATFVFDATGLNDGTYQSQATFSSNDPATPTIDVPISVTVIGEPSLDISDTGCVFMGFVQQYDTATHDVALYNTGCDTLIVSDINWGIGYSQYLLSDTAGIIMPGDSMVVTVTFAPGSSTGNFQDTIFISTNDADTSLCFETEAEPGPIAIIDPDTFDVTIVGCDDSITETLTIHNVGNADLTFTIAGGSYTQLTSLQNYDKSPDTTFHTFSGLPAVDTLYVTVRINGDYDQSDEWATFWIEGWSQTINDGNVSNGTDIYQTFTYTGIPAATILADGVVNVEIRNEARVGTHVGTEEHEVTIELEGTSWVNVSVDQDTAAVSDSVQIDVTFNSTGLIEGTYTTSLFVSTNDPTNPLVEVPCTLHVEGFPYIAVTDQCVDLDSIMEYTTSTNSFWVYNTGCDTLNVSDITSSLGEYTVNMDSFAVMPWDSQQVVITFAPASIGVFNSTLTIFNDDVDTTICVTGEGYARPVIAWSPDSFDITIVGCSDTISDQLTIYNNGSSDLNFIVTASAELEDDFESGLNGPIWSSTSGAVIGTLCGTVSGQALQFNGNGTRSATTVDMNSSAGGTVKFWLRTGSGGSCESTDNGEDIRLGLDQHSDLR